MADLGINQVTNVGIRYCFLLTLSPSSTNRRTSVLLWENSDLPLSNHVTQLTWTPSPTISQAWLIRVPASAPWLLLKLWESVFVRRIWSFQGPLCRENRPPSMKSIRGKQSWEVEWDPVLMTSFESLDPTKPDGYLLLDFSVYKPMHFIFWFVCYFKCAGTKTFLTCICFSFWPTSVNPWACLAGHLSWWHNFFPSPSVTASCYGDPTSKMMLATGCTRRGRPWFSNMERRLGF